MEWKKDMGNWFILMEHIIKDIFIKIKCKEKEYCIILKINLHIKGSG